MNQARFFHTGDDFHFPPGGRPHPFEKCLGIAGIAQCAGGDHPYIVGNDLLRGAMEPAQNLHRLGHRLWSQEPRTEDSLAKTRDLAVLV